MKITTFSKNYDRYIFPYAFLCSLAQQLILWFLEEKRYDFGFLWSGEILGFLLFTSVFAGLMIGSYYALNKRQLEPKVQLFSGLLIGSIPTLALILLVLLA